MAEQMSVARDRQASFRLEAEVRKAARARDLDAREVEDLVQRARGAFVFVNGEAQAVDGKRQPVRREDGGLVTVEEWMHLTLNPSPQGGEGHQSGERRAVGTFGPSPVALPNPKRIRSRGSVGI